MLLALKLVLVPALVVAATLAGRRWGPRIGGLLASFPIVAGPALLFFTIEQGDAFAAEAARGTLVALVAVAGSGLAYAWASRAVPWWASLLLSRAGFVVITLALHGLGLGAFGALLVALASVVAARALLPGSTGVPARARRSPWDLPLRTLSAMAVASVSEGAMGFSQTTCTPRAAATSTSGRWVKGGVQMSQKSRVSRASSSSAFS